LSVRSAGGHRHLPAEPVRHILGLQRTRGTPRSGGSVRRRLTGPGAGAWPKAAREPARGMRVLRGSPYFPPPPLARGIRPQAGRELEPPSSPQAPGSRIGCMRGRSPRRPPPTSPRPGSPSVGGRISPGEAMATEAETDWSGCDEVEQIPGMVSGRPILKGTRVIADSIYPNFEVGLARCRIAQCSGVMPSLYRARFMSRSQRHKYTRRTIGWYFEPLARLICLRKAGKLRRLAIAKALFPIVEKRIPQPRVMTERLQSLTALTLLSNQSTPLRPQLRPQMSHPTRLLPPAPLDKMCLTHRSPHTR